MTIDNEHGHFDFKKEGDKWKGKLKDKDIERYDDTKVGDLLRAYKALNADGFADKGKTASDLGLDKPSATLVITLNDGAKREIKVGATAEGSSRWVQATGVSEFISISSWAAEWALADAKKFQKPEEAKDGGAPASADAGAKPASSAKPKPAGSAAPKPAPATPPPATASAPRLRRHLRRRKPSGYRRRLRKRSAAAGKRPGGMLASAPRHARLVQLDSRAFAGAYGVAARGRRAAERGRSRRGRRHALRRGARRSAGRARDGHRAAPETVGPQARHRRPRLRDATGGVRSRERAGAARARRARAARREASRVPGSRSARARSAA